MVDKVRIPLATADDPLRVGCVDNSKARIMRLVHISDTHLTHNSIAIPAGDILVHSGDFFRLLYTWNVPWRYRRIGQIFLRLKCTVTKYLLPETTNSVYTASRSTEYELDWLTLCTYKTTRFWSKDWTYTDHRGAESASRQLLLIYRRILNSENIGWWFRKKQTSSSLIVLLIEFWITTEGWGAHFCEKLYSSKSGQSRETISLLSTYLIERVLQLISDDFVMIKHQSPTLVACIVRFY